MRDSYEGWEIAGKYRLEKPLGQGGMGAVWRAHHLTLDAPVAVKLIDPDIAANPDARARFIREARAAAALRSPNVVQTFDFGVEDDIPFIVMELMQGESLADRLERVGFLPPKDTARIISHVARAIGKAHDKQIIHRDLKPDNIYLVQDDDREVAKVLDFGVAKATGTALQQTDSRTQTGSILGTPYYMSPEQAEGSKELDWRTDLWALAVIAYECLVGARPFQAGGLGALLVKIISGPIPIPSQHAPVPPGFDNWFLRATQRDPEQRFQSAKELAYELRIALGVSLSTADATGPHTALPRAEIADAMGVYNGPNTVLSEQAPSAPASRGSHYAPTPVSARTSPTQAQPRLTTGELAAAEVDTTSGGRKSSSVGLFLGIGAAVLVLGGVGVGAVVMASGTAGELPGDPTAENPSSEALAAPAAQPTPEAVDVAPANTEKAEAADAGADEPQPEAKPAAQAPAKPAARPAPRPRAKPAPEPKPKAAEPAAPKPKKKKDLLGF